MSTHSITAEDILAAIKKKQQKAGLGLEINTNPNLSTVVEQELVLAQELVQAQEVYKDKNIKRYKDTSCSSESRDEIRAKSLLSQKQDAVVLTALARTSSCSYSGISVQHYITKTGIKLAISLQVPEAASAGGVQQMTAELKRYDRLHQIKGRADVDSDWFNEHLETTIQAIRDSKNHNICLGRPHEHRKRAAWFVNSFVVGVLDGNRIISVIINIEGEEYEIHLNQELTNHQAKFYHSTGLYGEIKKGKVGAPRIKDIPFTKFGS
jgi:hypothetical protein